MVGTLGANLEVRLGWQADSSPGTREVQVWAAGGQRSFWDCLHVYRTRGQSGLGRQRDADYDDSFWPSQRGELD